MRWLESTGGTQDVMHLPATALACRGLQLDEGFEERKAVNG